jgi:hypothetical protein
VAGIGFLAAATAVIWGISLCKASARLGAKTAPLATPSWAYLVRGSVAAYGMPYADAVMGLQALPDAMAVFGCVRLCSFLTFVINQQSKRLLRQADYPPARAPRRPNLVAERGLELGRFCACSAHCAAH